MLEDVIFIHELSSRDIELLKASDRKVEKLAKKSIVKKAIKATKKMVAKVW